MDERVLGEKAVILIGRVEFLMHYVRDIMKTDTSPLLPHFFNQMDAYRKVLQNHENIRAHWNQEIRDLQRIRVNIRNYATSQDPTLITKSAALITELQDNFPLTTPN